MGLFRRRPKPPVKPPVTPPPPPVVSRLSVWANGVLTVQGKATISSLDMQHEGQSFVGVADDGRWKFTFPPGTSPWGATLTVTGVEGFEDYQERCVILPDIVDIGLTPEVAAREGVPQLRERGFTDAGGHYLALGTSLFWAGWGVLNDPGKLQANIDCLKHRVDYIRVLMAVGPGGVWDQRTITMRQAIDGQALARLADFCYDNFGIRVMPTLFGGATGSAYERENFTRQMIAQASGREHKIHHWEVGNEANKNGFEREELFHLARILRASVPHAVALTGPVGQNNDGSPVDPFAYYDGSAATLKTIHLERDVTGTGGMWRPVRQAREPEGHGAWSNNEPIGIASSVFPDDDPLRLVMGAAMTWLCNGSSHVVHTAAGIYGVAYQGPTGPRAANLYEQPTFLPTLDAINRVREHLPVDLPNWKWENNNKSFPAYPFETDPLVQEANVLRSFLAHADGRFVCMPIKVLKDTPYTAKRAMSFDHYDPLTMDVVAHVDLAAGQTYPLEGAPDGQRAAIFIGQYR